MAHLFGVSTKLQHCLSNKSILGLKFTRNLFISLSLSLNAFMYTFKAMVKLHSLMTLYSVSCVLTFFHLAYSLPVFSSLCSF